MDAQRELRKKEKMEREMNDVHDDMDNKQAEIKAIIEVIDRLQVDLKKRQEENRLLKISLEQTNRQLQVSDSKMTDAQQKLNSQVNLTENLRSENQNRMADVRVRHTIEPFININIRPPFL